MNITKEVTVKLTQDEVRKLIVDHLLTLGIKVNTVHFNIQVHDREGDWRAEFPEIHALDEVICVGELK